MSEKPEELFEKADIAEAEEEIPEVIAVAPADPVATLPQFEADVMQALDEIRNAITELQDDEVEEEAEEVKEEVKEEEEEVMPEEETIIEPAKKSTPDKPKPEVHRGRIY